MRNHRGRAAQKMKITRVEAVHLRLPQVKQQCDSGQDALVVRVETDAGSTGIGEVDSSPMAAKWVIDGPFSRTITSDLAHIVMSEDVSETEKLWDKMYRANIYSGGAALQCMP
jgi:L-alanine-DL-glutamate epimerase-like enolase superfamily enzyme